MSIIKILQENKEYEFVCEGDFECSANNLKSLEGSPIHVGKDFWCHNNNNLQTLEGAPKYVGGFFVCVNNPELSREEIEKYYESGAVKGKIFSDYGQFK